MIQPWLMTFILMLNEAWSARRDAKLRVFKLQVKLLRAKFPGNRVILSPEDRYRLVVLGEQLDHDMHDVIGIVHVKTCRRCR